MAVAADFSGVALVDDAGNTYIAGSAADVSLFYAVFDRIVPATNKYMATLFNTSATRKVVVRNIYRFNWQATVVAGIALSQYLARITARTAGTSVTTRTVDTNDTLSAGITADTLSTAVTEDHIIKRIWAMNDEIESDVGISLDASQTVGFENGTNIYSKPAGLRGLTLRQNQGVSIRNVTASTVGSCSYVFEFTDEAV